MPESLVDSNLWVASLFPAHEFHDAARKVIGRATASSPVVFCRATQMSVLRLITTPRLLEFYRAEGLTNRDALAALHALLARSGVREREEPPGTVALWHRLASKNSASPKLWMDAYLAAFALAGGMRLVTLDRDFKAFVGEGLDLTLVA